MPKLEITKDLVASITASLPIGVCLIERTGLIVYSNQKAEEIFGFESNELLGHWVEDLMPERYRNAHRNRREDYSAQPKNVAMSGGRCLLGLKKNGIEISLQIGLTPLTDQYILISLVESTNEIIKPSSSNDTLTGLPNRRAFTEYSEKLRKLAIRDKKSISIVFVDLDNFKPINDKLGHHAGDKVIYQVADILRKATRESDSIARLGGDEFIICLYDMGMQTALKTFLDQLSSQIASINTVDGHAVEISASIGAIILRDPQQNTLNEMIIMADALMYEAKKKGKGITIINEKNFESDNAEQ